MADLYELLRWPEAAEVAMDVVLCAVPIWAAIMIGLVVGWSWRPRWTGLLFLGLRSRLRFLWTAIPPGLGARRLWIAFTAFSAYSVARRLWSTALRGRGKQFAAESAPLTASREDGEGAAAAGSSIGAISEAEHDIVTEKDLEHLLHLLDSKENDTAWQNQMERTTSNMTYQAWRHDPEVGPVIYCSRTVFEEASPELVRDFFWDDDFRLKWDAMLAYYKTLEEFPENGTMIVHWIKKFPFFCSDREYIIGRRIWECDKTYYCVTKGIPYPSLTKKEKPRRVEECFSSWRIRAVGSLKQKGQLTACEVTLVHYEDMGIPKDVAKVGVRHGMWGAVKKLQSGFRTYQQMRHSENILSRSALMARITTKISLNGAPAPSNSDPVNLEDASEGDEDEKQEVVQQGGINWKWVVIGGVAAVCVLQAGLVGKVLLVGAMRRQPRAKK